MVKKDFKRTITSLSKQYKHRWLIKLEFKENCFENATLDQKNLLA